MKKLFVFGLCVGVALGVSAQTGARGTFALKGKVVDTDGRPVEGATVERFQFGKPDSLTPHELEVRQKATTDTNGSFELRASRTYVLLLARNPGFAPAWKQLAPASDVEQRLVLTPRTAAISGIVVDAAGQPVTNAEVWAARVAVPADEDETGTGYSVLWSRPARYCFSTNTMADGRFRLEGFPTNATAYLAARAPGKISSMPDRDIFYSTSLPHQAGQEDVRLVLDAAGNVEGKIVVADAAQPPPTVRLVLQAGPGYIGFTGREPVSSGPDGSFAIKDVAAGSYHLRAVFDTNAPSDWTIERVEVTVEAGQTTRDVQVPVIQGGALEVTVLDKKDRKPMPSVRVNAFKETFQLGAESDSNGIALLRLPPGEYQVFAYKENWAAENVTATVEPGKTNRVEIELSPPSKITGVVRNPDGTPAAGLKIILVGIFGSPREREIKTDDQGRFELEFQIEQFGPPEMTPCLLVRDPERNLAAAQEIDEEAGTVELQLAAGLTLTGQVECDGQPVTNVNAALIFWTGNMGMHLTGLTTGTNVPGRFEIPALPPGRRYGIVVSAPGYGQRAIHSIATTDEAGRIELEPIELKPANLRLAGQVLDVDDKPVAGANVRLHGEGQPSADTRTDGDGRFSFDKVCEGPARLSASARDSYGTILAEGGDTNVILRLGETVTYSRGTQPRKLKGTVTSPDGTPAVGVQVAVFPHGSRRWVKTGTNGLFNITCSVQSWRLSEGALLVARDPARNLAVAEEISEDVTNVSLKLKPGLIVTGRVEDPDGKPLTNASVSLNLMVGSYGSLLDDKPIGIDGQGRFEIAALPPGGRYLVWANAKGYGSANRMVDHAEEGTNRIELEPLVLRVADRKLAGRVVDADDKPVSGAFVYTHGEGQPDESTTTDRQGRFAFNVCEGEVQLSASSQNAYGNARAEAGDTNVVIVLSSEFGSRRIAAPPRARLAGKALPDLATVNLASDAVLAGKPLLLCLFDPDQRPSRRYVRLLAEQHEALKAKGVVVVAVQATPTTADAFKAWKDSNPVPFPVGWVQEDSNKTRWATAVESLPWLILADAQGRVIAEGFAIEELEAKLKAVKE